MHIIIGIILTWFAAVVVMLLWESTEDPTYDFDESKESDHE
jgi:hypothetical protein